MMANKISYLISPEECWVFMIAAYTYSMANTYQLALECIYLIKFDVVILCGVGHDCRVLLWLRASLLINGVWGQVGAIRT
jgi:hypothetical protein